MLLKCSVVSGQCFYAVFCWTKNLSRYAERVLANNTAPRCQRPWMLSTEVRERSHCSWPLVVLPTHPHVRHTPLKNLWRFILQGPHVGVRTVWLWQGRVRMMLPERYLKSRKRAQWASLEGDICEHNSVFKDLNCAGSMPSLDRCISCFKKLCLPSHCSRT